MRLLLASLLVVAGSVHAQEPVAADADLPSWMYASATLGGGYFHHWQVNTDRGDRDAHGGVLSLHLGFGSRLSEMVVMGFGAAFIPGLGTSGRSTVGSYDVGFAPGGLFGLLVAVTPQGRESWWSFESITGIGGMSGEQFFGGLGASFDNGVLFHVLRSRSFRFSIGARFILGLWTWPSGGGFRPTVAFTADVGSVAF